MAKRISDSEWQPGIIYELRCCINGEWHPFYVGETQDPKARLNQHRYAGRTADESSTLVYRFIREQLEPNDIKWDMIKVADYGSEGPTDLEDEHIMSLLVSGVLLKNEKKGNANWMSERLTAAADMRQRGISSYRQYRQQLTYEEAERRAQQRHQLWQHESPREQRQFEQREDIKELFAKLARAGQLKREELAKKAAKKAEQDAKKAAELKVLRAQQQAEWEQQTKDNE